MWNSRIIVIQEIQYIEKLTEYCLKTKSEDKNN